MSADGGDVAAAVGGEPAEPLREDEQEDDGGEEDGDGDADGGDAHDDFGYPVARVDGGVDAKRYG